MMYPLELLLRIVMIVALPAGEAGDDHEMTRKAAW